MTHISFEPNSFRQGASHAALRYQYLKTIQAWSLLKDEESYVLSEWVDDDTIVDQGKATIRDSKLIHSDKSLTLRSRKVIRCLENAFVHLVTNSPEASVQYVLTTNLPAGLEQPILKGVDKAALEAWNNEARAGDLSVRSALVKFLIEQSALNDSVKKFLQENDVNESWRLYLGRISFDLTSGELPEIFHSIHRSMQLRCERYQLSLRNVSSFIEHLMSVVGEAASESTPKSVTPQKLTRKRFDEEWSRHFLEMQISFPQWCRETYGTSSLSVLHDGENWLKEKYRGQYSRREAIENGVAHFTEEEQETKQSVMHQLVGDTNGGIVAVSGHIGSGKTLFAASIAVELHNQAYQVFYASITADLNLNALIADIRFAQERSQIPIVIILDDCHRNWDVVLGIFRQKRVIQIPAILFVATKVDSFLRRHPDIDYGDVEDIFGNDASFSTILSKEVFSRKITGIVRSWASLHPDAQRDNPSDADLQKIATECRGNLSSLGLALPKWSGKQKLFQLVKETVKGQIYHRFLSEDRVPEAERRLLIRAAAVGAFDVDFCIPEAERDTAKQLRLRGLLEKIDHDHFRFMDRERPRQLLEVSLQQKRDRDLEHARLISDYIESHAVLPKNASQLLLALAKERKATVIKELLSSESTIARIEDFFNSQDSNRIAIDFLFRVRDSLDRRTVRRFFSRQIIDLPERFTRLTNDSDALLTWTKCLRLSTYCDRFAIEELHRRVSADLIEDYIKRGGFHQLAYCVWSLAEIDNRRARSLLAIADTTSMIRSAAKLPAVDFVRAIKRLRIVDVAWMRRFCSVATSDRSGPFFALLQLPADEFALFLGELNWYDELAVKKFLADIDDTDLQRFSKVSNDVSIAVATSTLKDVDRMFAQRFLEVTSGRGEQSHAARRRIDDLGNSLSELYRVSDARARSEFRRYSDDEIFLWGKSAPLFKFGKTFAELRKISPERTKQLFARIGFGCLTRKVQSCQSIGHLTKAINELAAVDYERARFMLDSIDDRSLLGLFQNGTVDSLARSLRELHKVDASRSAWVARSLNVEATASLFRKTSLRNLGLYLSEIHQVSQTFCQAVLDSIGLNALLAMVEREQSVGELFSAIAKIFRVGGGVRLASTEWMDRLIQDASKRFSFLANQRFCRFEEISDAIRATGRIRPEDARRMFQSLSIATLEVKARAEQSQKVLVALGGLASVDNNLCRELLIRIFDSRFVDAICLLAPDRFASALNSLDAVSHEHAVEIIESLDIVSFRSRFAAMDSGRQRQVARQLAAFSRSHAELLIESYVSNPDGSSRKVKRRPRRNHPR